MKNIYLIVCREYDQKYWEVYSYCVGEADAYSQYKRYKEYSGEWSLVAVFEDFECFVVQTTFEPEIYCNNGKAILP